MIREIVYFYKGNIMNIINLKSEILNAKKALVFSAVVALSVTSSISMDTLADKLAKPLTGVNFNEQDLQDELNALGNSIEIDDLSQSDIDLGDLEAEFERQEALEIKQKQDAIQKNKEQQANEQLAIIPVNQQQSRNFLSNLFSFVTGYIGSWFYKQ